MRVADKKIGDIFRRAQKETTVARRGEGGAAGGEALGEAGRVKRAGSLICHLGWHLRHL